MENISWKQMSEDERARYTVDRYNALYQVKQDYLDLWQDIVDFLAINRYNLDGTQQKGKKKGQDVYDAYACLAWRDFTHGVFGYMMSPNLQWFKLRVTPDWLMDDRAVKMWLEEVERILYASFARSNFYETAPEYLADGSSLGTATCYSEEDLSTGKTIWTVMHPGEIVLAENRYGMVDTVLRKFKLNARQAVQSFGEDNLSEQIKANWRKTPEQEFEFYHATFPADDIEYYFDEDGVYKPKPGSKPFVSAYVMEDGTKLIRESGYRLNPYTVWRCFKNSGEIYGRSPATNAIIDIIKLNQMEKTTLNARHMMVDPPLQVPESMRGKVRFTPRGRTYYDPSKPDLLVREMPMNISLPAGIDGEDRLRKIIDKHFMTDFFTLLSTAALEGRELTVPQVMEMQGEKAVMLAAMIGRLTSEFLDPVIDRSFDIEMEAGRIPPPPPILQKFAGGPIDVDYMGPLAQAQRKLFKVQGITQLMQTVAPLVEAYPDIVDNFDSDKIALELHSAAGAPVKILRDEKQVQAMRQQRQQKIAAQTAIEQAGNLAGATQGLSKPIEENSPLALMTGQEGAAQ
jgi:hypothetical protein